MLDKYIDEFPSEFQNQVKELFEKECKLVLNTTFVKKLLEAHGVVWGGHLVHDLSLEIIRLVSKEINSIDTDEIISKLVTKVVEENLEIIIAEMYERKLIKQIDPIIEARVFSSAHSHYVEDKIDNFSRLIIDQLIVESISKYIHGTVGSMLDSGYSVKIIKD